MNNEMDSAVRKIRNLQSSGEFTIIGPNILMQTSTDKGVDTRKASIANAARGDAEGGTGVGGRHNMQQIVSPASNTGDVNTSCYICDEVVNPSQSTIKQNRLLEMTTSHTMTKFTDKLRELIGKELIMIVNYKDVICDRCTSLVNYMDILETDLDGIRSHLFNLLNIKYNLSYDDVADSNLATSSLKMQNLTSGASVNTVHLVAADGATVASSVTATTAATAQKSVGTQTLQRKMTKIYKCLSCDYNTTDMRLFNTHYETCKHQKLQCKHCKKIFPNFGVIKRHMMREHNTLMENTCVVCHINFANESALCKHMELKHSTRVTKITVPVSQVNAEHIMPAVADATSSAVASTKTLHLCNQCIFKTTDKAMYDEHMRMHILNIKSKPFKCRICSQRFETRLAATIHTKHHKGDVFECDTCALSFLNRELLVKHFEVHQQQQQQQQVQAQAQLQGQQQHIAHDQQQQQEVVTVKDQRIKTPQTTEKNELSTHELLQKAIEEALGESTSTSETENAVADTSGYFCSLTFAQDDCYNQHMATHSCNGANDKKGTNTMETLNAVPLLCEAAQLYENERYSVQMVDHQQQHSNPNGNTSISQADIESIFEKMHSDKNNTTATVTTAAAVVKSEGSDITFNITIPAQEAAADRAVTNQKKKEQQRKI